MGFFAYLLGLVGAGLGIAAVGRAIRARHDHPDPATGPTTPGPDPADRDQGDTAIDPTHVPDPGPGPIAAPAPGEGPMPDRGVPRDHDAADDAPAGAARPSMSDWAKLMAPGAQESGIQLTYALKWIDMESSGNPCAIGYPAAHGPDGNPLELGIAQLYNPDDIQRMGLTGNELRAYCVPGDQHPTVYKGKSIRGFSQLMSRPITIPEMQKQATAAIKLIVRSMASASRDLAAAGAGPSWSPSRRDFWALAKLQHGLPALSRQGLPLVRGLLGRPPSSWTEFASALGKVKFSDAIEAKYRKDFPRILDNAWECSSAFVERGIV